MLSTLRISSLRATPILARTVVVVPTIARATVARFSANIMTSSSSQHIGDGRFRFKSAPAFAVDAPDGIHDDQDIEESHDWANRTVTMAAVTEDAAAINEMHNAAKREALFAVDAPDGEHDGEDVVSSFSLSDVMFLYLCMHYHNRYNSPPQNNNRKST